MKTVADALDTAKPSTGTQNMKTRHDSLGTAKTILSAQIKNTGPDALSTVENESGHEKHENGTRLPRYRRKILRPCKT
jgi:hypothetical protein